MLNGKGFDLWAGGYDESVGLSDRSGEYPFAGYQDILGEIYRRVLEQGGKIVLDIGFGTGVLTARLYEAGCQIWGQDFSGEMLRLAREKMPKAALFQKDFTEGLAAELLGRKYDAIIATYSLHHLTDKEKIPFLKGLLPLLSEKGRIYVGDIAFPTRRALKECQAACGDEWDDEEFYLVYEELTPFFPDSAFLPFSFCAGLLTLRADTTQKGGRP